MDKKIESILNEILEEGRGVDSERHLAKCSYGEGIGVNLGEKKDYWFSKNENPELYDNLMEVYSKRLTHSACPRHFKEEMDKLDD